MIGYKKGSYFSVRFQPTWLIFQPSRFDDLDTPRPSQASEGHHRPQFTRPPRCPWWVQYDDVHGGCGMMMTVVRRNQVCFDTSLLLLIPRSPPQRESMSSPGTPGCELDRPPSPAAAATMSTVGSCYSLPFSHVYSGFLLFSFSFSRRIRISDVSTQLCFWPVFFYLCFKKCYWVDTLSGCVHIPILPACVNIILFTT